LNDPQDPAARERQRLLDVHRRREREIASDRYAPWRPEEIFMRTGRRRVAAAMLRAAGAFPRRGDPCVEIGYGSLGWLGDLIGWGLREEDLHGIELDPERARLAREALPSARLEVGDATRLPWEDGRFRLAVVSTVFTSILDDAIRRRVAAEVSRVIAPDGALLWYDFGVNSPGNPDVRRVGRRELRALFPGLEGAVASVTLAPPLARALAPRSWWLATTLEAIPLLRTHLLAVLRKPARG
jgi:hypothetical protein